MALAGLAHATREREDTQYMHVVDPRLLRVAGSLALVIGLGLATLPAGPAAASGPGAPTDLQSERRDARTVVLSWDASRGTTIYQVEVDNDPAFGSPEYSSSTASTRIVPSSALHGGTVHWRVRATSALGQSGWRSGRFDVDPIDVPQPLSPADGATLQQPQDPALLEWSGSTGATSYIVQVDGDADFIGTRNYTTRSTSFVVPDALGAGDWFWRVIASKGSGINSAPSTARSFEVMPLEPPTLTAPDDTFEEAIEDVVLDWQPVSGATAYDVQVALDDDFQNFALDVSGIRGTRYSPPVTLYNDEFWWRVRAVDPAGLSTPWTESRHSFKRQWLDRPVPVHPVGTATTPGVQDVDTTYYEWTSVQHASMYEIEVAQDINFTVGVVRCKTAGTTYVPRFTGGDCLARAASSEPRWWRVRALDQPYERTGLPGVFSDPQAFFRVDQPAVDPAPPTAAELRDWHATELKVSMTAGGALGPATGCTSEPSVGYPDSDTYTAPTVCGDMRATPVFSWTREPKADYYRVYFAQDENFTTTELQPITTKYTMLALDAREKDTGQPLALPESESGRPYYWYVLPCREGVGCGPRPDSQAVGVSGAAAFQKVSPRIELVDLPPTAANDITFSWVDYHETSRDESWGAHGELGPQTAMTYRIEVDTERSFSAPLLDSAEVDQTTFTSTDLYPEGRLYWRVQAIDAEGNGLAWSRVGELVKSSPQVQLRSPNAGARVPGTTPLEWAAQPFATSYEVEVYRNADTAHSPANRVISARTNAAAFAPTTPLPASDADYVWRVRRFDASGNAGPWSADRRLHSLGTVPELHAPADGSWQPRRGTMFTWGADATAGSPDAVTYLLEARSDSGAELRKTTVATAWAPSEVGSGTWSWHVTALDPAGQPLGTSATSSFRVDGSAPTVKRTRPGRLRRGSTIKAILTEQVTGISKRSIKLERNGRKVRVKVSAKRGGRIAVVNPRRRLKRGSYDLVFRTERLTDRAGNTLAVSTLHLGTRR